MTKRRQSDGWSDWRDRPLPEGEWFMRPGNKIGRNLYLQWPDGRSEPIGQVDTAALAALICDAVNGYRSLTGPRSDAFLAPAHGEGTRIIGNTAGGDINITGLTP
jgi:hypothetical protein